jgi:proteic killer suppression protein
VSSTAPATGLLDVYPVQGYHTSMIHDVVVSEGAQKDLRKVPVPIRRKLALWVDAVHEEGLENVRKIAGYHDEPLKGDRKGQRSIRLSKAYRAIYEICDDGTVEFVSIEEVNKHDY